MYLAWHKDKVLGIWIYNEGFAIGLGFGLFMWHFK